MARFVPVLAPTLCAAAMLAAHPAAASPPVRAPASPPMLVPLPPPAPTIIPAPARAPPKAVPSTADGIPLEAFAAGPEMAEPHISPDGGKLVYVSSRSEQLRIVVRDLATGRERIILNAAADPFSVTHCEFKTNDRLLCHLEGVARAGDPARLFPATRLLAIDADGGAMKLLFRDVLLNREET